MFCTEVAHLVPGLYIAVGLSSGVAVKRGSTVIQFERDIAFMVICFYSCPDCPQDQSDHQGYGGKTVNIRNVKNPIINYFDIPFFVATLHVHVSPHPSP